MSVLEMKVPSPGESISEVEIAEWLVEDGDYVEKDQTIAEVDSDKATLELPAEAAGTITLKAEEGDTVEVGQVVCLIDTSAKAPEKKEAPKKEDYSWVAKTPDQKAKLKTAKDLLKIVEATGIKPKFDNLFQAPIINKTGKYQINRFYILPIR